MTAAATPAAMPTVAAAATANHARRDLRMRFTRAPSRTWSDVQLEAVVGQLVSVRPGQLFGAVRQQQPLRLRRFERLDGLFGGEVVSRLAVELPAQECRLAHE